jgi:hypothetical protein
MAYTQGYRTTEFYLVIVSMLIDGVTALVNSNVYSTHPTVARDLLAAQTVLVSVYALGRSLVKAFGPSDPAADTTPVTGGIA